MIDLDELARRIKAADRCTPCQALQIIADMKSELIEEDSLFEN